MRNAVFAAVVLCCWPCPAGSWQPIAIARFAGWAELKSDVQWLGTLVNNPRLARQAGEALTRHTDVHSLRGLDPKRPWGAVVHTDGLLVTGMIFLPVNDTEELLRELAPLCGEPLQQGEHLWKIGRGPLTAYVRRSGDWAFMAQTPEVLDELPEPERLLSELPVEADLAVVFYPQNIPEALRTFAIDELRSERKSVVAQLEQANGTALAAPELATWTYARVEEFLTDIRKVTLAWTLDAAAKRAVIETTSVAIDGTAASRRWSAPQAARTLEIGITDGICLETVLALGRGHAGAAGDARLPLGGLNFAALLSGLRDSDAGGKAALACADAVRTLLANAAQASPVQASLRVRGIRPPYAVVMAARLDDVRLVQQQLDRLAAADPKGEVFRIERVANPAKDLQVHAIRFSDREQPPPLKGLLGNDQSLYLATHGDYLLIACGDQALAALRTSLPGRQLAGESKLFGLGLRLSAILAAAAHMMDDSRMAPLLTIAALSLQSGDDRLMLTMRAGAEGLRTRVEMHEGVLRAAALAIDLASQRPMEPKQP